MVVHKLKFSVVPGAFAVCRLPADAPPPTWMVRGTFLSVTRSAEELSVVTMEDVVPDEVKSEKGWACLKLHGPFPFQLTGILASFIGPLAEAGIPIFAVSTFDTDYVLLKEQDRVRSLKALVDAGHELAAS
jgi:hypothetical protein